MTTINEAVLGRLNALSELQRRIVAKLEAIDGRLSMSQPRVVITGTPPGQTPIPKGGRVPSREGVIVVDVASRRLLVCAEGRWWEAALKPAVPFDDLDLALEKALARIAALEAKAEEDAPD